MRIVARKKRQWKKKVTQKREAIGVFVNLNPNRLKYAK